MTVLQNFLAAATIEKNNLNTDDRMARIAAYLRYYPENPSAWVFMNLPAEIDQKVLIQQLDFGDENGVSALQLLAIYSVGLSVAQCDDFDSAYTQLEKSFEALNTDGYPTSPTLQDGLQALKSIYGVAVENEQA